MWEKDEVKAFTFFGVGLRTMRDSKIAQRANK